MKTKEELLRTIQEYRVLRNERTSKERERLLEKIKELVSRHLGINR